MKFHLTLLLALILQLGYGQNKEMFFEQANTFFEKYAANNSFNYEAAKNSAVINVLIDDIAKTNLENLEPAVRKAYMINAYNLLVINQVIKNYPLSSVQDVTGFFDKKIHIIGGVKRALNEFEKESILGFDKDPRYHFVLVCGAVGCPPITNFAYMPDNLDQQMEKQTKIALNNPAFISADGSNVTINQIFNWYASDFGPSKRDRIKFVNTYAEKSIPTNSKFKFSNYDWTLNDKFGNIGSAGVGVGANASRYVVSSTIPKGTAELKLFNNLFSQQTPNNDVRSNFFTTTFSALYGVNNRFNAGIETKYRRVSNINTPSSALDVFGSDEDDEDVLSRRARFTGIGPKIRWAPTPALPNFSIQSTFQFALGEDLEGSDSEPFIDWNKSIWITQFFNDIPIGTSFSIFTEIDVIIEDIGSDDDADINRFSTPATLIFSYFPNPKTTVFALAGYSPFWQDDFNYFFQYGGGVKYQFTRNFEIELLVTDFNNTFLDSVDGSAATYNLGIRFNL